MHNLLRNVEIALRSSAIAGSTSNVNTAGLDMSGYEGVSWVAFINGSATTQLNIKAQECSSSGFTTGSDVGDLTGTEVNATTSIANGILGIDLYRPNKRWVRCVVVKPATADLLDGVLGFRYRPSHAAVTHSTASVISVEYFATPATGTA